MVYNHQPTDYRCPFCRVAAGEDLRPDFTKQADVVFRDSTLTVFVSSAWWPANPGNVLVVPNEHYENVYDIPDTVLAPIQVMGKRVALTMKATYGCDGTSFWQHNEPGADQEVWHYHRAAAENLAGGQRVTWDDDAAVSAVTVTTTHYRDVRSWLDLAAEVEWLFGDMLGSAGFYQALLNNIERGTAFCVREDDGPPGAPLLGGLLFSLARPDRPEYHIRWLAVTERSRRLGVGTALVEHVFGLITPPATLSVITFGEDIEPGRAARRFYERLGFHAAEPAPRGPEGGSRQVYRRLFPCRQAPAGGGGNS